ncbi:MAG TPA: hypothetical protein VNF29_04510 [Candidatus Binataceae bacterium]|nr:hypothetical protein [Candidatus Binataceae bacterium]
MAKVVNKLPAADSQAARRKRSYVSPRLIEYGAIAKLTATNGTILPQDSKTGAMMGSCL